METRQARIKDSILRGSWAVEQLIGKRINVVETMMVDGVQQSFCKYSICNKIVTEMIPTEHLEFDVVVTASKKGEDLVSKEPIIKEPTVVIFDDPQQDELPKLSEKDKKFIEETLLGDTLIDDVEKKIETPLVVKKYEQTKPKTKPRQSKSEKTTIGRTGSNYTNKGKHKTR